MTTKNIRVQIKIFLSTHFWLIMLGIVIEAFYLCYLLHDFPLLSHYQKITDMGIINHYSHAGFITFMLVFSLLFTLLIIAQRSTYAYQGKATFYLIIGFGLLFSGTLLFVYPINAIDIFGYIAESRVLVLYHADPLLVAPASYTHDPLIRALHGFVGSPAPYGPLEILITSIATLLAGSNLLANLLLLKVLCAFFLSGSAYLVYKIMQRYRPEMALSGVLFLAWNPYMQLEYVVNSHNDIIMAFFVLLALLALITNRHIAAFALILLASLVKYTALPLLLLFFVYAMFAYENMRGRVKYCLWVGGETLIILVVLVLPFWRGPQTLIGLFTTVQGSLYSFSMFLRDLTPTKVTFNQSKTIGPGIFAAFYLYAIWRASLNRIGLLMGSFLTMFALLAFAVTYVQPWYIIWVCIPALLIPRKHIQQLALLLTYGATMMELVHPYMWPWGAYRNAEVYAIINSVVYLILFGPAMLLLSGNFISDLLTRLHLDVH